ncbi:MAG: sugar-transfer associated ATP-grasp domain-containing protein, partial [Gammaproteobacteria bacterium]
WKNEIVYEHPDTHNPVQDFAIPRWEELLMIATKCSELTGLGYLGVDMVLDRVKGPLLLEMNARPGLSIQIANRCGLLRRLEYIHANGCLLGSAEDKVSFSRRYMSRIR